MEKTVIAAVLTAVVCGGATAAPAPQEKNLVRNPYFTDGKAGWSVPSAGWKVLPNEGMNAGEGALVWENEDPAFYAFPVQHFKPIPGASYRFRVFVRTDALSGAGFGTGIECTSADGVWLFGKYARPVYDNDVSVKDGWVKYEGVTGPLPANVGRCGILCAVYKGATGRVRFSGFSVEPDIREPVSFFVSSRYRDEAQAGAVTFFAGLHVNVIDRPFGDYSAEVEFRDRNGRKAVRSADEFTIERAVFGFQVEDLAGGPQDLTFRLLGKTGGTNAVVASATRRFTRLTEPAKRRIAFDSARRLLIDGKPFFPLGMYGAPNDPAGLDKYLEAPFNFTTLYGLSSARRLDPYAARGIYVATDVRTLIDGYDATFKGVKAKTREESRAAIRAKVDEVGNHPALLLWYLTDEVTYNLIPNVAAANDYFHELDSVHPTFAVQNNPKDAEWYLPCCDVMATDCYPIGNHGRPIAAVGDWVRVADEKMGRIRPAWQVPQAINWSWYFKGKDLEQSDLRFPTRDELANMCWQSVAAGANGICMYAYHSMVKGFKDDPKGFDAAWASVVSVAKDLKRLEPVLLSDPSGLTPTGALPKESSFRAWTDGEREMVLFVNATRNPLRTTLAFQRKFAGTSAALGPAPQLAADGRSVEVELPALGVTVFSLRPQD